jgi:hypothetical protein
MSNKTSLIENVNGYDWSLYTGKDGKGNIYCAASACKINRNAEGRIVSTTTAIFTDPYIKLVTKPGRATQKMLDSIHEMGEKAFEILRQNNMIPHRKPVTEAVTD